MGFLCLPHSKMLGQLKSLESLTSLNSKLTSLDEIFCPSLVIPNIWYFLRSDDSHRCITCQAVSSFSPQSLQWGFPVKILIMCMFFLKVQCPISSPITVLKSCLLWLKMEVELPSEDLSGIPYYVTDLHGTSRSQCAPHPAVLSTWSTPDFLRFHKKILVQWDFSIISFAKLLAVSMPGIPLYPGTELSLTSFHFSSATRSL